MLLYLIFLKKSIALSEKFCYYYIIQKLHKFVVISYEKSSSGKGKGR